jgi:hypothetical protein
VRRVHTKTLIVLLKCIVVHFMLLFLVSFAVLCLKKKMKKCEVFRFFFLQLDFMLLKVTFYTLKKVDSKV